MSFFKSSENIQRKEGGPDSTFFKSSENIQKKEGGPDSTFFKSSENIQKKEGGPDSTVLNNQFTSLTLNELAMNTRDRVYYNFEFQRDSQSKD